MNYKEANAVFTEVANLLESENQFDLAGTITKYFSRRRNLKVKHAEQYGGEEITKAEYEAAEEGTAVEIKGIPVNLLKGFKLINSTYEYTENALGDGVQTVFVKSVIQHKSGLTLTQEGIYDAKDGVVFDTSYTVARIRPECEVYQEMFKLFEKHAQEQNK